MYLSVEVCLFHFFFLPTFIAHNKNTFEITNYVKKNFFQFGEKKETFILTRFEVCGYMSNSNILAPLLFATYHFLLY
jgi:hypothetical protein